MEKKKKIASPARVDRVEIPWHERRVLPTGLVSEFFNSTLGEGQRPTERRIQVEEQRITPVGDGVNPGQVVDARQVCSFFLCPSYTRSALFPPPSSPFLPALLALFPVLLERSLGQQLVHFPIPAYPRIGVPQKGRIELTGYKLDISSAGFRIKCLSVAHT